MATAYYDKDGESVQVVEAKMRFFPSTLYQCRLQYSTLCDTPYATGNFLWTAVPNLFTPPSCPKDVGESFHKHKDQLRYHTDRPASKSMARGYRSISHFLFPPDDIDPIGKSLRVVKVSGQRKRGKRKHLSRRVR